MVIKATKKHNKTHLVMNTTKDGLKDAHGYKYDRNSTKWMPDNKRARRGAR